jgi:hypothetical protein
MIEISDTTKKTYTRAFERLKKAGWNKSMDYYQLLKILDGFNIKDKSKTMYMKSLIYFNKIKIITLTKETFDRIQFFMRSINVNVHDKMKSGVLTDAQKKNYLNWDKINEAYNKIQSVEPLKIRALVGLFIYQRPRRILDYSLMNYVKKYSKKMDQTKNYYVRAQTPYFIFNKYKTAKYYHQQKIPVNRHLAKLINDYIDESNIENNNCLFNMNDNNFKQTLRNIFKKYTGKYISVNLLRHSYISHMQNKNKFKTIKSREHVARQMGHGITSQMLYYADE